jgi:DNA-binding GntR family transcriptional regulator
MSQADLAYRNLRYAIVEWRVDPGAWLTESELQAISGFARTPTREAAGRLIADGLLSVMPRNGYRVADVSVGDAAALFDVWEALAPMTGRLAVGQVDELAMTLLRKAVAATTPLAADVDALIALIEELFDAVLLAAANPWLRTVGLGLFNHLLRLWVLVFTEPSTAATACDVLSLMLTALDAKDPAAGEEAFVYFTARVREATLEAVERFTRDRAAAAFGRAQPRDLPG